MNSTRLTIWLFYLSDTCAWLLAALVFCLSIVGLVFGHEIARFDGISISSSGIAFNAGIFALVGIGALALTRRKIWGLFAASALAVLGSSSFAIFYLLFVVLIFGTPLGLAMMESRRDVKVDSL